MRPASRLPSTLILSPELIEGSKDQCPDWRARAGKRAMGKIRSPRPPWTSPPKPSIMPGRGAWVLSGRIMLKVQKFKIDDIYVPTARRKTLHPETVRLLAEDILENGQKTPIQVRFDGKRHILVEGLHRLEASKWLGETAIDGYLVQSKRH